MNGPWLRRHADYQAVYTFGKKQNIGSVAVFFLRRNDAGGSAIVNGPRIGLAVSRRVGKAHERNRIKRRFRAAVQRHVDVLSNAPIDVVLHPRRNALQYSWEQLEKSLVQILGMVRTQVDSARSATASGAMSVPSQPVGRRVIAT